MAWPVTESSLRRYLMVPHLGRGDGTLHTGEIEGSAAAHAKLVVHGAAAHLGHVLVDPSHRGRGLGRWLVEALLALAAERGCDRVTLNVFDVNMPALRVYERAGFSEVARTRDAHRAADGSRWATIRMTRRVGR